MKRIRDSNNKEEYVHESTPYYMKWGVMRKEREVRTHDRSKCDFLVVGEAILSSAYADGIIKVHDLRTLEYRQTLSGHKKYCGPLVEWKDCPFGPKIISGSKDITIKKWDLEEGEYKHTLGENTLWTYGVALLKGLIPWQAGEVTMKGHSGWINCLVMLNENKLASGSWDETIKIWDLPSGECEMTLKGHSHEIYALIFVEGKLISGSFDKTIKIWDPSTGECERTLKGHNNSVNSLVMPDDGRLVSGSRDMTLRIWALKSGECEMVLRGHTGYVNCVLVVGDRIISGSSDGTIKMWDPSTGNCVATLKDHVSEVHSLAFSGGKLYSGDYYGKLMM